jgi:LysR family nitrogen assimilation transcriptional regulator
VDLRQLRYFLVVAELGSFTKAAAHIPLAQSALSRQMRLLEEELGVKLLIRTGRGITVTEQGIFLRDRAASMLEQIEDTRRNLVSWYDNPAGLVRVGMPPTATLGIAATLLAQMKIAHENITVRMSEGLSATLVEWLMADRLDMAIVFEPPANSSLVMEVIGKEELCLVVPRGHKCPNPVSIEEISKLDLIAPFNHKGIRNRMAAAFADAGVEFEVAYEIDALAAIKDLVRTGAGVSMLAGSSVRRDVELGQVETRVIASDEMTFDVFLVFSKVAEHSRAARATATAIRNIASTLFDRSDR